MVLGKLFSIGNGAKIQTLEKGRNCPDFIIIKFIITDYRRRSDQSTGIRG